MTMKFHTIIYTPMLNFSNFNIIACIRYEFSLPLSSKFKAHSYLHKNKSQILKTIEDMKLPRKIKIKN